MRYLWIFLVLFACSKKQESKDVNQEEKFSEPTVKSNGKYDVLNMPDGKKYHTGLLQKEKSIKGYGEVHMKLEDCENLPDEFDLRKLGVVPETRDQGQCGSCWSFSKTGSLESALAASSGKMVDLSEQELVACDRSQWACQGGLLSDFKYQIDKGQGLEADYPYISGTTGVGGRCKSQKAAAKGMSFAYIGSPDKGPTEKELKCALYKTHTIPWITVSASGAWGSPPSSEKQVYSRCGHGQTNHAVGVVGWFKNGSKTAFIMRNSWGKEWGDGGFMSMPLGCDSFGDEAAYIITEATPCKPPMIKLPAEVQVYPNVEIVLGVKATEGWDYKWFEADKQIATGSILYVTPGVETAYKLVAKSACGSAESSVKVKMVASDHDLP